MAKIRNLGNSTAKPPRWFALYAQHRHEKAVASFISGKGLEVFLPLYKTAHRWKDRMKELELPLFPNYVFVLAGSSQRAAVLSTPGEEIDAVRLAVGRGLNAEPHPFLRSGDRVRVKSGPLQGLEGILVRKKNFYRLVLSVELLVKSISVEVEACDVERTGSRCAGPVRSMEDSLVRAAF
jgi:transcription antitermination factor NusG